MRRVCAASGAAQRSTPTTTMPMLTRNRRIEASLYRETRQGRASNGECRRLCQVKHSNRITRDDVERGLRSPVARSPEAEAYACQGTHRGRMAFISMRQVRIFVSSPGDCAQERALLDEAVERINK